MDDEPNNPDPDIGKRLKIARKKANLTQEDAADLVGATRATLIRWEKGESEPRATTLGRLANAYGVSCDWIVSGAGGRVRQYDDCLLVSDTAMRIAERIADNKTPMKDWPPWLVQPPQLRISASLPFEFTVVPPNQRSDMERAIRALTNSLLGGGGK